MYNFYETITNDVKVSSNYFANVNMPEGYGYIGQENNNNIIKNNNNNVDSHYSTIQSNHNSSNSDGIQIKDDDSDSIDFESLDSSSCILNLKEENKQNKETFNWVEEYYFSEKISTPEEHYEHCSKIGTRV